MAHDHFHNNLNPEPDPAPLQQIISDPGESGPGSITLPKTNVADPNQFIPEPSSTFQKVSDLSGFVPFVLTHFKIQNPHYILTKAGYHF